MEWKLFATLAEVAGERSVTIETDPDSTVDDAIDELLVRHPELRGHVLDDGGNIQSHVTLLYNGTQVSSDRFDAPIADDDELAMYPPVTGG